MRALPRRSPQRSDAPAASSGTVRYNRQPEIRQLLIDWVTAEQVVDPSTFAKTNPDWQLTFAGEPLTITP